MNTIEKINTMADYMGYELIGGLGYFKKGKTWTAENKLQRTPDPNLFDSFANVLDSVIVEYDRLITTNVYAKDFKVVYTVDMGDYSATGTTYPKAIFDLLINVIIGEKLIQK